MNIPKEVIEKAIEGGWQGGDYWELSHRDVCNEYQIVPNDGTDAVYHGKLKTRSQCIALDPSFWQSLGSALGWAKEGLGVCVGCGRGNERDCRCDQDNPIDDEWHYHAMRFYDLILTSGDTDAYWKELLAK